MVSLSNIFRAENRYLLKEMIRTNFKLRYQGSVLGYLWSLLKPMFMFGILYLVFTQFLRFGEEVPNFAVSLLLGIVLWTFFSEATINSLSSIVEKGDLIRKIKIPRYTIVLASVAIAGINLILNIGVVMAFILISGISLTWSSLLFPLLLAELLIITTAVSFFLSAAFVRFRDISYIWEVMLQGMFYLVPLLYPLSMIPNELARKFIMLNPLAQIVQDSRAVLTHSGTTTVYDIFSVFWVVPFIIIVVMVVVSTLFFKKESINFAENV
ncbi:MAG: ABC transporter permease [Candidatus Saccharimonadales bacterium]